MGPIIILDKSAMHGLSGDEHRMMRRYFKENLTPILAAEIMGDLAKSFSKGRSAEDEVAKLTRKFGGSGPAVCVDYRKACAGNLTGHAIPMTGQIPVDYAHVMTDERGRTGAVIGLHPINESIMKWSAGRFVEAERAAAAYWREHSKRLGLKSIEERLERNRVIVPRSETLEGVLRVADELLSTPGLQAVWLDWLVEELDLPRRHVETVRARWLHSFPCTLETFAPYAAHVLRVQLCLYIATKARLLGDRRTNLLDARYLYYLPFCMVFVSGDVAHHTLAPMLVRPDQTYVRLDEFKIALASLVANPPTRRTDVPNPKSDDLEGDLPLLAGIWRKHCWYVPAELLPAP